MVTKPKHLRFSAVLALVLVLAFTGLALAGSSTTLLGYQLDYLGFVDNGNGTSTWTYAFTATPSATRALSNWALNLESCYDIVKVEKQTITTGYGCGTTYNCQAATCQVSYGKDPHTGFYGFKFENCSPQLDPDMAPVTHVFQFTLKGVPITGGDVNVGLKAGQGQESGLIHGPACSPNAVALNSLGAVATSAGWPLAALGLTLGLAGIGAAFRRARG